MKKVFEITINYIESAWGTVYSMVEAETEEEARKLFEADPWEYDWDGGDTHDSEVRGWDIESIDECPESTRKLKAAKEQKAYAFDEALDMVERIAEEEKEKSDGE